MPEPAVIEQPKGNIGETNLGEAFDSILTKVEPVEAPIKQPEKVEKPAESKAEPKKEEPSLLDSLLQTPQKPASEPEKVEPSPTAEKSSVKDYEALYERMGIKGEKARENFEKLSQKTLELEKKNEATEKALAEQVKLREQGDPNAAAKIKDLESKLTQLEPLIEQTNLQRHPSFVAQFTQPKAKMLEQAKATLKEYAVDPATLEKALVLNGKPKAEALDAIYEQIDSPSQKGKLERLIDGIEQISVTEQEALNNAKLNNERLAEQARVQQFQQSEKHSENVKQSLDLTWKFLRDEHGLELLRDTDNPKLKEIQEQVRTTADRLMLKTTDPTELASAAILAPLASVYRNISMEQAKRIQAMEAELKDKNDSQPGLGGSGSVKTGDSKVDDNADLITAVLAGIHS